jgi:hypothetical protein
MRSALMAEQATRIDRIGSQVSSLRPGRAILSAVAGLLWLVGVAIGLLLLLIRTVLWTIPVWCYVAIRLGTADALRPRDS